MSNAKTALTEAMVAASALRGLRQLGGGPRQSYETFTVQTSTAEPVPEVKLSRQQIRRKNRKEEKHLNKIADSLQRKQRLQELRNGKR